MVWGSPYARRRRPLLHQRSRPRLIRQTAGQTIGDVHGLPGEPAPFRIAQSQSFFDAFAIVAADVRGTRKLIAHVPPHSREIRMADRRPRRRRGEIGLPVAGFGNPRSRIVQPLGFDGSGYRRQ